MVKGTVERKMKKKIQNNDCYQVVTFQGCQYLHLVAGKFKKSVWETEVFKIKVVTVKVGGYKLPGLRKSLNERFNF